MGCSWGHYEQARVRQAKLSSFLSARLGAYFPTQHSQWGCLLSIRPRHHYVELVQSRVLLGTGRAGVLLAQAFSTSSDHAYSCVVGWGVCVFRDIILHISRLGLPKSDSSHFLLMSFQIQPG